MEWERVRYSVGCKEGQREKFDLRGETDEILEIKRKWQRGRETDHFPPQFLELLVGGIWQRSSLELLLLLYTPVHRAETLQACAEGYCAEIIPDFSM